ncbi:MAG: DUF4340 domain-containing protein [Deltaproteobacteria bacterium]|nr:DUF4340 domain-containing protein [Deltaproteobacteria bacterium]
MKKEYLILAVIIAVLVGYLAFHDSDRTGYELPTLAAVSPKKITRLEIVQGDTTLTLDKKDDQWRINEPGYPADETNVKRMLTVIEDLTLTTLISASKSYARYDLTPVKQISIKAWVGQDLIRDFQIGKIADTYQHTFVKLAQDSNVYHARGNFRNNFDQTEAQLRDKTVLSFNKADINEIVLSRQDDTLTLRKETLPVELEDAAKDDKTEAKSPETKTRWQTPDGRVHNDDDVDMLLSKLYQLNCDSYPTDGKKEDVENPSYTLTLKGNQTHTLSLFNPGESETEYPATSSANAYLFKLSKYNADGITGKVDTLMSPKETTTEKI